MSDDLAGYLAAGASTPSHPLDRFTNRIVTSLLMRYCIPWLSACLQKYTEAEFHERMGSPSFDFIEDWYLNHPNKYTSFIKGAKKMRHRFTFDTDIVLDRVVGILQTRAGWTVYPYEHFKLRSTIERVRVEIYS